MGASELRASAQSRAPTPTPIPTQACASIFQASAQTELIASVPSTVPAAAVVQGCEQGWDCASLVYVGEKDWFSWPTETRDGTPLNVSDDTIGFVLTIPSQSEQSAAPAALNLPWSQSVQLVAAVDVACLPGAHDVQLIDAALAA